MLDGMRSGAQSWFIKLAFGLIILVFIFWGIGSNSSSSGVVAKVNGEPITINEFQQSYNQMANEIKSVIPDVTEEQLKSFALEQRVLQNLVINKLFLAESKRLGIEISIAELRSALMGIPFFNDETGKFSQKVYEERLKAVGQSPANFENSLRMDLLPQKFQEILTSGIYADPEIAKKMYAFQGEKRSIDYVLYNVDVNAQKITDEEAQKVYEERKNFYTIPAQISLEFINFTPALMADEKNISDDEVKTYYDKNKASFTTAEQVKARHILISVNEKAPQNEVDNALKQIKDIASKIKSVDDFAKMAKQYGQDGTKAKGGDLGWFTKEQMVPEFADVAFTLPLDTLSEPVRTQFGYHLIWVEDKKEAHEQAFDDVKDDIRYKLAVEKVNANLQDTVDASLANLLAKADMKAEAEKLHLKVENTDLVDAQALVDEYGMRQADVDVLMGLTEGTVWDTPLSVKGELSVLKVIKNNKSGVKTFAEVKKEIIDELKLKKAQESAMALAEKQVKDFDKNPPKNIQTSVFFTREGQIKDLGPLPDLAKLVFENSNKQWIKKAFLTDEGAIVARLNKIQQVKLDNFKLEEKDILLNMQDAQKNMLFQAYILMLNKEVKVDILMPEIFNNK